MAHSTDRFLVRKFNIRQGDQSVELLVQIQWPQILAHGESVANATISCLFFQERIRSRGLDQLQAMALVLDSVRAVLLGKTQEGFDIWWLSPGDIAEKEIWGYK